MCKLIKNLSTHILLNYSELLLLKNAVKKRTYKNNWLE